MSNETKIARTCSIFPKNTTYRISNERVFGSQNNLEDSKKKFVVASNNNKSIFVYQPANHTFQHTRITKFWKNRTDIQPEQSKIKLNGKKDAKRKLTKKEAIAKLQKHLRLKKDQFEVDAISEVQCSGKRKKSCYRIFLFNLKRDTCNIYLVDAYTGKILDKEPCMKT